MDYEPLPAVTDPEKALKEDAPILFEENESIYDIHNLLDWAHFVVDNSFHILLVVVPNIIPIWIIVTCQLCVDITILF